MKIFFIMIEPLPTLEEQDFGLAWWNMKFITVNNHPVPFKSKEDAQTYLDSFGFTNGLTNPKYTIWELVQDN